MHLVVPFASADSPAAREALAGLSLPSLERLLARLDPAWSDEGTDELSLNPPHERALAHAWGWPLADGLLPFAALAAQRDGLPAAPGGTGWALLSPAHWHVGTEQVSLADPAELALDEPTSRRFFDTLAPLFADDGWSLAWGAPTRWYARHASLAALPTAALDRVIGRNVDFWLGAQPGSGPLRRLQAEAQMLLHEHPLNEAREAQGLLPVNSFWLSGTGPTQPVPNGAVQIDERLRAAALAEDWAAWAEAWATLDAGPIADGLRRSEQGQPVQITLCGERQARSFASAPRPWWRRGLLGPRRTHAAPLLTGL
jgi:hypothetical protein